VLGGSQYEERESVMNQNRPITAEDKSLPGNGSATTGEQIEDIGSKKKTGDPTEDATPKLLMVHQLWLWKLNNGKLLKPRTALYICLYYWHCMCLY
jgi:hypothetical protein